MEKKEKEEHKEEEDGGQICSMTLSFPWPLWAELRCCIDETGLPMYGPTGLKERMPSGWKSKS